MSEELKEVDLINLNDLAVLICEREGGKVNLSIAQVKEVLKHTLDLLGEEYVSHPMAVVELLVSRVKD